MGVLVRFVSPLILLAGGVGLLIWAVVSPHPVLYVMGALAAAAAVAGLLFLLLRTRAEQREGSTPASRRARVVAGGVGTALALALAVVLVGVPLVARWLPTQEGIIRGADSSRGRPVVVAGHTYLAYGTGNGPAGVSLSQVNLADGSRAWSITGLVYLTREGEAVAQEEGMIRYYDSQGQLLWETEEPDDEDEAVRIVAAHSGDVVVDMCTRVDDFSVDCHYGVFDASGDRNWEKEATVVSDLMPRSGGDSAARGRTLPAALRIVPKPAEVVALIDPSSGETMTRYSLEADQAQVYGTTLLAEGRIGDTCRIDAYRLTDGVQQWSTDQSCPDHTTMELSPAASGGGEPSVAYVRVRHGGEQSLERNQECLAVDLEDGPTRLIQRAD